MSREYILITGASSGIGEGFARAWAREGRSLILTARRGDRLEKLRNELQNDRVVVEIVTVDLNEPSGPFELEKICRERGWVVHGLINNAAITNSGGKSADELSTATWDAVMNVNVRGTWLMSVAAMSHLRDSGRGSIVNIASDTALWGAPKLLAYVASKGAVIAMTRTLAREFGAHGITVNAIAPGLTEVEATAYVPAERHEYYLKGRALNRAQVPDDVNGPVLFLLSDAARFVTGQLLPVNGGFVMN